MEKEDFKLLILDLVRTVKVEIPQSRGYWPTPVAAGAIGEHLGNAAQNLRSGNLDKSNIELISAMWVLTCVANQYCSPISIVDTKLWNKCDKIYSNLSAEQLLNEIYAGYGQILNLVFRYERGIFITERPCKQFGYYAQQILQAIVYAVVQAGGDFQSLLAIRVAEVRSHRNRPQVNGDIPFEPSEAESLLRFDQIAGMTACPFAKTAKVWATPTWRNGESATSFLERVEATTARFSRIAGPERFDGLVIETLGINSIEGLKAKTNELVTALGRYSSPNPLSSEVERKEWRMKLFGVDVFFTIFSSIYPATHSRYSQSRTSTIFFIQLQSSFTVKKAKKKEQIRESFARKEQDYRPLLRKVKYEAQKYIKPIDLKVDEPIEWWDKD